MRRMILAVLLCFLVFVSSVSPIVQAFSNSAASENLNETFSINSLFDGESNYENQFTNEKQIEIRDGAADHKIGDYVDTGSSTPKNDGSPKSELAESKTVTEPSIESNDSAEGYDTSFPTSDEYGDESVESTHGNVTYGSGGGKSASEVSLRVNSLSQIEQSVGDISPASPGILRVYVDNVDGSSVAGATVVLYDSGWNELDRENTNSYGVAYFSVSDGKYFTEVYYDSPAALGYTEFWGGDEVWVSGSSTNFYFTRHTQWAYEVKVNNQYVPTSVNVYPGDKIHVDVKAKNSEVVSKNVKVTVILDRNKSPSWDLNQEDGPVYIGSNNYGDFDWDYYPSSIGTYYIYVVVWGYYNNRYIITDQWDWTKAFVVSEPEYNEYFYSIEVNSFDDSGDGLNDAVQVKMDVDTTGGTLLVDVDGYLYDPSGSFADSDSDSWWITGYNYEYGYIYLYAPSWSPEGWYDIDLYLYDDDGNFEDESHPSAYLYPWREPKGKLYVEVTNNDDDNHVVDIYVDGGYWSSIIVSAGGTATTPADKEVDPGNHKVEIKWYDPDTDDTYSKSLTKYVGSNDRIKFSYSLNKYLTYITIHVNNVDGSSEGSAPVLRYDSGWNYKDRDVTDSSGWASWSSIPDGTYNFEVYNQYDEFWGDFSLSVGNSGSITHYFTRFMPYAYEITTSQDSISYGDAITVTVKVKNPSALSRSVRVRIIIDRSKGGDWDHESGTKQTSIASGDIASFDFSWIPDEGGTYYVWTIVETYLTGPAKWVLTDHWAWYPQFTVQMPGHLRVKLTSYDDDYHAVNVYIDGELWGFVDSHPDQTTYSAWRDVEPNKNHVVKIAWHDDDTGADYEKSSTRYIGSDQYVEYPFTIDLHTGWVTVTGQLSYIDGQGNPKPVDAALVELYDEDWEFDDWLDSAYTTSEGLFVLGPVENIDNELGESETRDLYIKVKATNWAVNVVSPGVLGSTYDFQTVTFPDVPDGEDNWVVSCPSALDGVFNILSVITKGNRYIDQIDETPPQVLVTWPDDDDDATSEYDGPPRRLYQGIYLEGPNSATANPEPDEFSDEVILHEYGHFIMDKMAELPSFTQGDDRHFWIEGWAQFFQAPIRHHLEYPDPEVYPETGSNLETWRNIQDEYMTVGSILWDIYDQTDDDQDGDGVGDSFGFAMGFNEIWDVFRNYDPDPSNIFHNHPTTIHEFWDGWFARGHGHRQNMWAVFYEHGINKDATVPNVEILSPSDGASITTSVVDVTWTGSDDTSGMDHYEIRLDSGSWINIGLATSHTFSGVTEGFHTVEVKAVDRAGLEKTDSHSLNVILLDGEIADYVVLTTTVVAGEKLRVEVTVENIGAIRAEYNVYIGNIWDSEGASAGNAYSESHQIIQLDPGDSQTLTLEWTTPDTMLPGVYTGDLHLQMARPGSGWEKHKEYPNAISFTVVVVQHKLTVFSAYDSPDPSNGDHYYDDGTLVAASVISPVTGGDTVWTCTGWVGTGFVPSSGSGTSVTFTITQDSSITWNWKGEPVEHNVDLSSRTDDANPNIGKIIFKGITEPDEEYTLPATVPKKPASYIVWASLEDSGYEDSYEFLRWEVSGGVTADPIDSAYTMVTITDDGLLTAVWKLRVISISKELPDGATYRSGGRVTLCFRVKDEQGTSVAGISTLAFVTPAGETLAQPVGLTDLGNGQYSGSWDIPDSAEAGTYSASFQASTTRFTAYEADHFVVDTGIGHIASGGWTGNVKEGMSVYFDFFIPYQETTLNYYTEVVMRSSDADYLVMNLVDSNGNNIPATGTNPQRITLQNEWGYFKIEIYGSSINDEGTFYVGYMSEYGYNRIFEDSEMWREVAIYVGEFAFEQMVETLFSMAMPGEGVVGFLLKLGEAGYEGWSWAQQVIELKEFMEGRCLIVSSRTTDGQYQVGTVIMDGMIYDMTTEFASETIHHLIEDFYKIHLRADDFPGYTFHHWEDLLGDPIYLMYSRDTWVLLTEPVSQIEAVYEPIESTFTVTAHSPVAIMVTDPAGSRIGFDPTIGQVVNEIPGATYSGLGTDPQEVIIHNPIDGTYVVDAFGTDTGTFTIIMESLDYDGLLIDSEVWTGMAEPEGQYTQEVEVEPDGNITDATPPITTETTVTPTPTTVNPTLTATVTDVLSTVIAAEYFIDTTGTSGTGTPLSAVDGAFDELSEEVTVIISISALIQGEHTVYVHGKDSADNWGDFDSFTFVVVKTYLLTVEASHLDASGGTFLVTYTLNQVTYIDEEHTTPWTTEADVSATVTISSPQQVIDKVPDDETRYAYESGAGTFTMDSDKTVTLVYKTQYYLTMSTNFGAVSPGSAWFDAGTTLTIEATAPSVIEGERYVWLGWTGIGDISYSGMDNPAIDAVIMNNPVSETASWRHEFRLTITTNFGTTDPTAGDHWYEVGTIVTISATSTSTVEGERYVWNGWTGTGDIAYTGADNPASITVNSPITETASWTHEYYLTTSTNFGSVSPTSNWFEAGSVIEISATPPSSVTGEQYVWNGWSGTSSGSYSGLDNPSSVTMNNPITEIASWTHQFYLEIEVVNEIGTDISSVVTIAGQGWYDADTEVDLTAPQDVQFAIGSRYDFRSWAGDVTDTTNTISVIMTAPRAVTAHYMTQYYLTVNNGGHGTTSGEGWYDSGVSATFSISPTIVYEGDGTRYVFTHWSGDSTSPNPSDTILMDGPKTITANWKTQYHVIFEQTGSGATTYVTYIVDTDPTEAVPFSIWAKAGSMLTFSYDEMVNDGEPTRYVLVNVDHTSPLTVNTPMTITATYKTQHYLTLDHSPIDPILDGHQTEQDYYDADSIATVTADLHVDIVTEESRYEFDHWSGGASGTSTTTTIIMNAPKTATANYKIQYYITVTSAHDSSTPSAWVNAGSDFTASVTSPTEIVPNDHQWVCTGYRVDGGAYQAGTSDKFTNVQATHSIDFAWKQQFWIQVNSIHDSPTPSQWIDQGDSLTVSVTSPADDDGMGTRYRCTGYTLDSNPPVMGGSTSYNFENVQEALTITFNWTTQYRLIVTSDHDSPDPTVGEHWYDGGTSISASVSSPADDDGMGTRYRCTGWTLAKDLITTSGSEISFSFSIDAPSTLTWNWIAQYYLTMSTNFGEVSPLSDWYDAGTEVNILATSPDVIPNERYVWNGWSGTGTGSYSGPDNPALITMNSPISETASWTHQYYIIVVSAHDTPTPSDWVDQGNDFTASVTSPTEIVPSDHKWVCTGFNVDEESAQLGTSYTFTNVQAPHAIIFNWKKQFWIQVNSDHDDPTPSDWVDQGDSFTASVTSPADIEPGHHQWVCSGFSVDGGALQSDTSYTFIDVQAPHTIVFSWWEQFWVTLTYTGDIAGQYSDPASVSATLTVTETGQPLQGKTITFTIGTQSASAITNETGIAATTITFTQAASLPSVTVEFAGDTVYLPRTIEESFAIDWEDATVEYTGDTVVPTTARTINLRATVYGSDDGSWGDLTKILATFRTYRVPIVDLSLPEGEWHVHVSETGVPGVGVAVVPIDILSEGGYLVFVSIDEDSNDYYRGSTPTPTPLMVYEPTGAFVTGGGWIVDPTGSHGNFGFNVRYTKSGRTRGHSIYVYRDGGWDYIVKSNAWTGLAIQENHAFFEGKCVIQKYNPATGELVWAEGNYKFRVDVWDNDSDGGVDIYQIRVLDKNGVLFHEAGFTPMGYLQGGNIVIHDEKKKHP